MVSICLQNPSRHEKGAPRSGNRLAARRSFASFQGPWLKFKHGLLQHVLVPLTLQTHLAPRQQSLAPFGSLGLGLLSVSKLGEDLWVPLWFFMCRAPSLSLQGSKTITAKCNNLRSIRSSILRVGVSRLVRTWSILGDSS